MWLLGALLLGLTYSWPPILKAHLVHNKVSFFAELNLIFCQMKGFIMTSWALENPAEPFLNQNFPKYGPYREQSQQGTGDNTWFQMLSSSDLYIGYNILQLLWSGDATNTIYCSKHQ